jgi:hypothetical protein
MQPDECAGGEFVAAQVAGQHGEARASREACFRGVGYWVFGGSGGSVRPKNSLIASAAFRSWLVRPMMNGALRGPGMVWPPACTVYSVTGNLPLCW